MDSGSQHFADAGSHGFTNYVDWRYHQALLASGVLTPLNGATRNRAWQAAGVIELLDAFAARSRRR